MFSKLAAARQLGISGLFNRTVWRIKMFIRIILFHVRGRQSFRIQKRELPTTLSPKSSFLPSRSDVETLLANDVLSNEERLRIARLAEMICTDETELRGIGQVSLRLEPNDWYAQNQGGNAISTAESAMINRHDFLLPLVQLALIDSDPKLLLKIRQLFTYWIENFNVSAMLRSDTPIDAAIRLINWLWVLNFNLLDIAELKRARLLEIINIQVEYISAWRSLGGNHLLLEAPSN